MHIGGSIQARNRCSCEELFKHYVDNKKIQSLKV